MTGACRLIFLGAEWPHRLSGARLGQEVRTGTLKACGGPSPPISPPAPNPEETGGAWSSVGGVCEGRAPCPDQASPGVGGAFDFQPANSRKS